MNKQLKERFLNIPNSLTLIRILLVPVFLVALLKQRVGIAFAVLLAASITDGLDGLAARMWNQKTKIGKLLDPAADKLIMTTAFIALSFPSVSSPNVIPYWLTLLVVGRDLGIASSAFLLFKKKARKDFSPTILGKISTISQFMAVVFVLFLNYIGRSFVWLDWIFFTTLTFTVLSGLQYAAIAYRSYKKEKDLL